METILEKINRRIRYYDDFPKPGIRFIDVLPLLGDSQVFAALVGELDARLAAPNIAAPEARGFLFAAPLLATGAERTMTVFRKNGKMPAAPDDLADISIMKEYGADKLWFRKSDFAEAVVCDGREPAIEVTIFDDVLATGGTALGMAAGLNGLTVTTPAGRFPVRVVQFLFLVEIASLGARACLEEIAPVSSVVQL